MGPEDNSISIIWEDIRNQDSQTPTQIYWIIIRILVNFLGDSYTHFTWEEL